MLVCLDSGLLRSFSACAASCRPVCPLDKLWTIRRWKVWWADKATRLCWGNTLELGQLHFLPLARARSLAGCRSSPAPSGHLPHLSPRSVASQRPSSTFGVTGCPSTHGGSFFPPSRPCFRRRGGEWGGGGSGGGWVSAAAASAARLVKFATTLSNTSQPLLWDVLDSVAARKWDDSPRIRLLNAVSLCSFVLRLVPCDVAVLNRASVVVLRVAAVNQKSGVNGSDAPSTPPPSILPPSSAPSHRLRCRLHR